MAMPPPPPLAEFPEMVLERMTGLPAAKREIPPPSTPVELLEMVLPRTWGWAAPPRRMPPPPVPPTQPLCELLEIVLPWMRGEPNCTSMPDPWQPVLVVIMLL